jgi:hypothetical protein
MPPMGIMYFASNRLSILTTTELKKNRMMAKGNNSEKNTGMKNFKILRLLDLKIDWQAMDIMSKR